MPRVIKVRNSLKQGEVTDFVLSEQELAEGRPLKMYVCGPTVYDKTHIGHARNYTSLDIIRRVLIDEGYNVECQINITDIDDKIILRARQNYLFDKYAATLNASDGIPEFALAAVSSKTAKLQESVAKLVEKEKTATKREKEGLEEQVKMANLKLANFLDKTKALGPSTPLAEFLAAAKDAIAEALDARDIGTVSDHDVFNAHSRKYEREWQEDMDALNNLRATVITRVTDYVEHIVHYVKTLVVNGYAYHRNGSVYFDVAKWKGESLYPKLRPQKDKQEITEAEMEEGEGTLSSAPTSEKLHPHDFALWKASKPGEPSWLSEWGPGRPGWHIECSVMAHAIFGDHLHMHAGGVDLKFPHHDNEIAQSEAYNACTKDADGNPREASPKRDWVDVWLHTGHLHIEGLKMSKSLKNFITVREALEKHTARQLRLVFLMQAWDKPMTFNFDTISNARAKEETFKVFLGNARAIARERRADGAGGESSAEIAELFAKTQKSVSDALADNFDTSTVITALVDLIAKVNVFTKKLDTENQKVDVALLGAIAEFVQKRLEVFGLEFKAEDDEAAVEPALNAFAAFREQLRDVVRGALKRSDVPEAVAEIRAALAPAAALPQPEGQDGRLKGISGVFTAMTAAAAAPLAGTIASVEELKGAAKAILAACDAVRTDLLAFGVRLEDIGGLSSKSRWRVENAAEVQKELNDKKLDQEEKERLLEEKKRAAEEEKKRKAEAKAKKSEKKGAESVPAS